MITELASTVRVVGTFDYDVEGVIDGTYCSVLVTQPTSRSHRHPATAPTSSSPPTPSDSLSGWISLQSVAGSLDGVDARPGASGRDRTRRASTLFAEGGPTSRRSTRSRGRISDRSGLSVVGHGPRVPCLPLVTSGSSTDDVVGELRAALADTVRDPAMADVCATLKIRDFLVRDLADYEGLAGLAELG